MKVKLHILQPKLLLQLLIFAAWLGWPVLQAHQPGQILEEIPPDSATVGNASPFARISAKGLPAPFFDAQAPHAGGDVVKLDGLRIPIFLIWTGEERATDFNNPSFDSQIQKLLFETHRGTPSLRNYMTHLFSGRVDFLYQTDLIKVRLPGSVEDYWIRNPGKGSHPRRHFFSEFKAWAEQRVMSNGKIGPGIPSTLQQFDKGGDGVIDMAIFLFVTDNPLAHPMRSWTEWTGANGWTASHEYPAVELQPPGTQKIKLSSYCAGRILAPPETPTEPPESKLSSHGWIAHEIFHCFGLPDVYDAARNPPATAGCGSACVMGWGEYGLLENETGAPPMFRMPVTPSAWCRKFLLDQLPGSTYPTPLMPPSPGQPAASGVIRDISLPTEDPGSFVRVELSKKGGYPHYLMVELRAKAGTDAALNTYDWDEGFGNGGFLIWEIDESVGRKHGVAENTLWPMAFLAGITPGAENRDKDNPLMALRTPPLPPDTIPRPRANLPKSQAWRSSYCWGIGSPAFEMEGVRLFDFNPGARRFAYTIQPAVPNSHAGNTAIMAPHQTTSTVTSEHEIADTSSGEEAPQPLTEVTIIETAGEANLEHLSTEAQEQIGGIFKAYGPKQTLALREEPGVGISLSLPIRTTSAKEFLKDFSRQLKLLGLHKAAESGNSGLFAKILPDDLARLKNDRKSEMRENLYIHLGGEDIRVKDTHVVIRREGPNKDELRYEFTTGQAREDKFRMLREELMVGSKRIMEEREFKKIVNDNMSTYMELLKSHDVRTMWEIVADITDGSVSWHCRIPTRRGNPPWIVKCNAVLAKRQTPEDVLLELK